MLLHSWQKCSLQMVCYRPGWSVGILLSSWDWRLFSKGTPLRPLVLPELCTRQDMWSDRETLRMVGTWPRATERTDNELSHWAIMTSRIYPSHYDVIFDTKLIGMLFEQDSTWLIPTRLLTGFAWGAYKVMIKSAMHCHFGQKCAELWLPTCSVVSPVLGRLQ